MLPELPPDHRDYEWRLESNNRIQTRIKENAIQRWFITMNAWTALYGMLARCCEKTAATLFRTLQDQCNLEKTHGLNAEGRVRGWAPRMEDRKRLAQPRQRPPHEG